MPLPSFPSSKLSRLALRAYALWGSTLLFGCDFISSASEITFGEGSLPSMEQEMIYPSVDEFVGLDEENSIPGLPDSLNEGTLAHLVGALNATGECGRVIQQEKLGAAVRSAEFELAACAEDMRCADLCEDGFLGLVAKTRVEVIVMTEEQAKDLGGRLSEDSADAILQIRFQMRGLEFFQGAGESREVTNEHIKGFEMWINTPERDTPLLFLGPQDLDRIYQSALAASEVEPEERRFERYELPREHPLTQRLISDILSGGEVALVIEQRFQIERSALYDLRLSPAGAYQSIQPEVVVNAIEAATSTLLGSGE